MWMNRRSFLRFLGTGVVGVPGALQRAGSRGQAALVEVTQLARHPYVQNLGSDRATILWTTRGSRESEVGTIEYSTDQNFTSSVTASVRKFLPLETGMAFPYYQYQAEISGLKAGTGYFYRVLADGQNLTALDELRFRTEASGPFSFLVFGDSGMDSLGQFQVAQKMINENPALVLHTGDVVYPSGTFEEYEQRYFDYYRNLMRRVPFYPVPGNHDYETKKGLPYLSVHALPSGDVPAADRGRYYSFDWGNAHFIALDSNTSLDDAVNRSGKMLEWLENDLKRTRLFWRVVYFHHPPYARGLNQDDPTLAVVRERVVPILERYDVPLVFNGHEHSYQRSNPIKRGASVGAGAGTIYITTGGGGADLYSVVDSPFLAFGKSTYHYVRADVNGLKMTLTSISSHGVEIDTITLSPPPIISTIAMASISSASSVNAPRGLIRIRGQQFAAAEVYASSFLLPMELSGVTVTLDGRPLPLYYVSGNEITAQLRVTGRGRATVKVTTANGSAESSTYF